jgi:septation ring formation regulator
MNSKGYPLSYLNLEYNISETEKKINAILDKVKVLNLDDSLFELKTMLNYFDSLFKDFEIEKSNKKIFEENRLAFENKIKKTNKIVEDIYNQIEDIKNMYNLTDDDLTSLTNVNELLLEINIDYKELTKQNKEKTSSYTTMNLKLEELSNRLKLLEEELDNSLKSLGSMYDDEIRAKEQLDKIEELLKQAKTNIRNYKIPIISNNYFIELAEAKEAIEEIVKELEKKPITIKVLNTRVDTARDLVLKLFNTTNEMIKYAFLSEMIIVYGNRYRSADKEIDDKLSKAEILFFKGNYKKSLNLSVETLQKVEPDIEKKLLEEYNMIN